VAHSTRCQSHPRRCATQKRSTTWWSYLGGSRVRHPSTVSCQAAWMFGSGWRCAEALCSS